MKSIIAAALLASLAFAPTAARSANQMAAMQYYVGNWSCVGGEVGKKATTANVRYWLDNGLMRQWVSVSGQGMMKPYELNATITWDAKNGRYLQAGLDTEAQWWISYGKLSGSTETWTDHATGSGKLGRSVATRTNDTQFTYQTFDTIAAAKPYFRVVCKKQ
jgi:hypothetical protein